MTAETISAYGITNIPAAPPVFVAWASLPDLAERLAGVRTMISGAAALAPAVFTEYAVRAGNPVWEGYGLTEAAPVVSSTMVGRRAKPGCVGSPLPGVEVRLVDESGETSDPEDTGEIWVRGANLFSGYWPDGREGPDTDGWWATGDVAYADEDGDLHLVDRRRDLVIVSGFNVYPYEVETVIASHPAVAEVAVIGLPHDHTGETVAAYVVPLVGTGLTADDVRDLCEQRLARFKCPTTITILDSLPHTSTGQLAESCMVLWIANGDDYLAARKIVLPSEEKVPLYVRPESKPDRATFVNASFGTTQYTLTSFGGWLALRSYTPPSDPEKAN